MLKLRLLNGVLIFLIVVTANANRKFAIASAGVPHYTLSPNHRYGVTVPHYEDYHEDPDSKNELLDLSTSRVLTTIHQTYPAYDRNLNHHGMAEPRWARDSSILIWEVPGKWFPDSYVVVRLKNGKVLWQRDLLKLAQDEILEHTRQAAPSHFQAAKEHNRGNGSAYPEGFSVDVEVVEPIDFPLKVRIALTSNPKDIQGLTSLDSYLFGELDSAGDFKIRRFRIGPYKSAHIKWIVDRRSPGE